ncbi:MAG: hypothetical protein GX811_05940 [Lentisphaerae bacterium]|nr:hypothetical protein [Lentisphaerota bacterium]
MKTMFNKRTLVALLFLVAVLPSCASSFSVITTNNYMLESTETVAKQLIVLTQDAELNGTVQDDLFLIINKTSKGEEEKELARLNGEFGNDVLVVANSVKLSGNVHDHARIFGRKVAVNGSVSNATLLVGSSVFVMSDAKLMGDCLILGEKIDVHGDIGGNLDLRGKVLTLAGTIAGNVRLIGEDIVILPGTEIGGDLKYSSSKELVVPNGVIVNGTVTRSDMTDDLNAILPNWESWSFVSFLSAVLCGLILVFVLPHSINSASQILVRNWWKSLTTGFVVFTILLTLTFVSFIIVIGLQLGIVLLAFSYVLGYTGKFVCALAFGNWIFRGPGNSFFGVFWRLVLGLMFVYLLFNIPGLSGFVWIFVTLAGTGALLLTLFPVVPKMIRVQEKEPEPILDDNIEK